MRDAVFFEGERAGAKTSRFWMLLSLASVIAAAGVVADSDATVIGAMIVAPLMTPILGIVLATVVGDRANLFRSWGFVVAGAAASIGVGYVVGLTVAAPVVAATNAQVAARVSPALIDLLAALATGAVGAIALVRKDISDTLPGVAIAISLVPPLTVVGLTLESGAPSEALGALLLFVTNVAAILATGVVVMALYRVGSKERHDLDEGAARSRSRVRAIVTTVVTVVIVGVPLAASSLRLTDQELLEAAVRQAAEPWATTNDLTIEDLDATGSTALLQVTGAPPEPDTTALVQGLRDAGVDPDQVVVQYIPATTLDLSD
ncbi:DUF389 domain-containing protein [Agromyces sp. MMS24-K17]|uniref:DUF389 domain-containing protein n=1 Tax=Agromyces sp. MMS24-K17 TaxID=3372850 RepID=UPI003754CAD3